MTHRREGGHSGTQRLERCGHKLRDAGSHQELEETCDSYSLCVPMPPLCAPLLLGEHPDFPSGKHLSHLSNEQFHPPGPRDWFRNEQVSHIRHLRLNPWTLVGIIEKESSIMAGRKPEAADTCRKTFLREEPMQKRRG